MKVIINNRYIKSYKFNNQIEFNRFIENQDIHKKLILNESKDNFQYCYICYDSLTSDKLFLLSFSDDSDGENMIFLFWDDKKLFVIETGDNIFIVDENMIIITSLNIITPIIGLFITTSKNLIILEEATMRLVDSDGKVLINEQFDLLEDYNLDNNKLYLKMMNEESKVIELL
ncbi:hypothetical protein [Aquimarina macrocephali]|uniref:hypothetical protein n=1 Tax=Aquimarina macrocephali TaxID=666563 RepID=UPI003F67A094